MSNIYQQIALDLGIQQKAYACMMLDKLIQDLESAGIHIDGNKLIKFRNEIPKGFSFHGSLVLNIYELDDLLVIPERLTTTYLSHLSVTYTTTPDKEGDIDDDGDIFYISFLMPTKPKVRRDYMYDNVARHYIHKYVVQDEMPINSRPVRKGYSNFNAFADDYRAHLELVRKEVEKFPDRLVKSKALAKKKNAANRPINMI